MFIKKILETYMDITDPNEILSTDRNKMLMEKLTSKFVGVCYNSCYILKINRIIRRSYIYMKDTLDGDAHTNVMFEVDAIEYIKDLLFTQICWGFYIDSKISININISCDSFCC